MDLSEDETPIDNRGNRPGQRPPTGQSRPAASQPPNPGRPGTREGLIPIEQRGLVYSSEEEPVLHGDIPYDPNHVQHSGPGGFSGALFAGTGNAMSPGSRNGIGNMVPPGSPSWMGGGGIGARSMSRMSGFDGGMPSRSRMGGPGAAASFEQAGYPSRMRAGGWEYPASFGSGFQKGQGLSYDNAQDDQEGASKSHKPKSGKVFWRLEDKIQVRCSEGPLGFYSEGDEQRWVHRWEMGQELQQQWDDDEANGIPLGFIPTRTMRGGNVPCELPPPMLGYVDGKRQLPDGSWIDNFIIPQATLDERYFDRIGNKPGPRHPAPIWERKNAERAAHGLPPLVDNMADGGGWTFESNGGYPPGAPEGQIIGRNRRVNPFGGPGPQGSNFGRMQGPGAWPQGFYSCRGY